MDTDADMDADADADAGANAGAAQLNAARPGVRMSLPGYGLLLVTGIRRHRIDQRAPLLLKMVMVLTIDHTDRPDINGPVEVTEVDLALSSLGPGGRRMLADYWEAYNTRKGWTGRGWRPSDLLAPYSPRDRREGVFWPLRIHGHFGKRNSKTSDSTGMEVYVEWVRWPLEKDWTWVELEALADNTPFLRWYVERALRKARKPELEDTWWRPGGDVMAAFWEMERRLGA
ncbi:hypothetical protein QBC39DRAFT_384698 [Podospora conica]|nr:hypothetical protein QBC39DRAFT_384698 [Schizothecium conicum]